MVTRKQTQYKSTTQNAHKEETTVRETKHKVKGGVTIQSGAGQEGKNDPTASAVGSSLLKGRDNKGQV